MGVETVCTVFVLFSRDTEYGAYLQNLAPMENQLRDAQLVCTVSSISDIYCSSLEAFQVMFTVLLVGMRSTVISVSVCLCAYLKNNTSKFHQIFCTCYLSIIAQSSSGSGAIRYVQ